MKVVSLYVVTAFEMVSISNTWLYVKEEDAQAKFLKLARSWWSEKEFEDIDSVYEFMSSEEFLDEEYPERLSIDLSIVEGEIE